MATSFSPTYSTAYLVGMQAIYKWPGQNTGDLIFDAGDIIDVFDTSDPIWWKGILRNSGAIGTFPANYVTTVEQGRWIPLAHSAHSLNIPPLHANIVLPSSTPFMVPTSLEHSQAIGAAVGSTGNNSDSGYGTDPLSWYALAARSTSPAMFSSVSISPTPSTTQRLSPSPRRKPVDRSLRSTPKTEKELDANYRVSRVPVSRTLAKLVQGKFQKIEQLKHQVSARKKSAEDNELVNSERSLSPKVGAKDKARPVSNPPAVALKGVLKKTLPLPTNVETLPVGSFENEEKKMYIEKRAKKSPKAKTKTKKKDQTSNYQRRRAYSVCEDQAKEANPYANQNLYRLSVQELHSEDILQEGTHSIDYRDDSEDEESDHADGVEWESAIETAINTAHPHDFAQKLSHVSRLEQRTKSSALRAKSVPRAQIIDDSPNREDTDGVRSHRKPTRTRKVTPGNRLLHSRSESNVAEKYYAETRKLNEDRGSAMTLSASTASPLSSLSSASRHSSRRSNSNGLLPNLLGRNSAVIAPDDSTSSIATPSSTSCSDPDCRDEKALRRRSTGGLSHQFKKIFNPTKALHDEAQQQQRAEAKVRSVLRALSPDPESIAEWRTNFNPFAVLENSIDIMEPGSCLQIRGVDFTQIDIYARNIKHRASLLTPEVLACKYLVRPYRRDIEKARVLFTWVAENIRYDDSAEVEDAASEKIPTKQAGKGGLKKHSSMVPYSERADAVLQRRTSREEGYARLFHALALAVGLEDPTIVHGHRKLEPGDLIEEDCVPAIEHYWNAVKIDGEYRFIDCALASPTHPCNRRKSELENYYFLTRPSGLIYTHFASMPDHQFLDPPVAPEVFSTLPYVTPAFFRCGLEVLDFEQTSVALKDDEICHLNIGLPEIGKDEVVDVWAEVVVARYESQQDQASQNGVKDGKATVRKRALSQYLYVMDRRVCKIKAVMPNANELGLVKVYTVKRKLGAASDSSSSSTSSNNITSLLHKNQHWHHHGKHTHHPYPGGELALVLQISHRGELQPFNFFIQHRPAADDFYVREPVCRRLYAFQPYRFHVVSNVTRHRKLQLRSPNGKMHKFIYFPQEFAYELEISLQQLGAWDLVCAPDPLSATGSGGGVKVKGGVVVLATWICEV
ncbi:uncharacterized protein VTP21DRAFT_3468 [Calcarisporiella thermophila]|uniref:uncharacterized protein n=1 Tax=Calcarisporiella thermophila TaxID=911321 RepID=UPI0037429750